MKTKPAPPRWLREVTARLGLPRCDHDPVERTRRWLWRDGDVGVIVECRGRIWQAVAFTPVRSALLRSGEPPIDAQLCTLTALAGLHDLGDAVRTGLVELIGDDQ